MLLDPKTIMLLIGTYYSDYGEVMLYKSDISKPGWVTNICYYIPQLDQLYSPTISKIADNGRDHNGKKQPEHYWMNFVQMAHPSFVIF